MDVTVKAQKMYKHKNKSGNLLFTNITTYDGKMDACSNGLYLQIFFHDECVRIFRQSTLMII